MTFDELLDQAIALLRKRGRMSYRALTLQLQLDDVQLEALREELTEILQVATDQDNRMLVWTGDAAAPGADTRREAESRFHAVLPEVIGLLQREGRVTYRRFKAVFGINDALLAEIREELTFTQLARDVEGKGLMWTGGAQRLAPSAAGLVSPLARPEVPAAVPSSTMAAPVDSAPEASSTPRAPEAERRQLTVMFCDLADSTQLAQKLDAEDLREVIRAYQATAAGIIHQFDGTIAQYLGDGLLVYFGWPIAHEDDAPRAVHAGLGIIEAITSTLNPRLQQEKGVQIAVRIGIHTGPVVVGEMGGDGRHEQLATGNTVNIASRLEGLAAPNTVVISQVTARLVQDAFALEDLDLHVLKGGVEPMQVFRVLSLVDHVEDEEHDAVGMPFLVGRDEELGLLRRRWEQSKEGLGQVVLISGDAGIGKSTLVETLRRQVRQEGLRRIAYRCSPYHTNSALYPVIAHVQRVCGLQSDDTPHTRLDKLERILEAYHFPLDETVPLLASLLSIPLGKRYVAISLSPQQQRQQTQDTLLAWLLQEAERQPVLTVWEDLHWADPSTLELLGLLVEQAPTVAMLHVLTFRPDFTPAWPARSHLTPITLNRLERPQVEALIAHLAGGKVLPAEMVAHIVAKTDGVPLYVEELSKMLLASNLLHADAEHYVLTGPLTAVSIPDTLQDSLMARLDRQQRGKEVAQIGAVIGREFTYELLCMVSLQDEEAVQVGLSELVEAELLYQRGRPPRSRYIFKHALIQDVAYQSLLRNTRQQAHQRIAQILEKRFPEIMNTQPEIIAYHYTEAGLGEQAVVWYQQANDLATQQSAYHEAIAHVTMGLSVLKTLPKTAVYVDREIRLLLSLGRPLVATKGASAPEVGEMYSRLRELCDQGEEPALHLAALRGLRPFYTGRAEHRRAADIGEESLRVAQQADDPMLLAEAHFNAGAPLSHLGEIGASIGHFKQALALQDASVSRPTSVSVLSPLDVGCRSQAAVPLWLLGYPNQARRMCYEALTISQKYNDSYTQGVAQLWALVLYTVSRDWSALREEAIRLENFAMEFRLPQMAAASKIMLGWWRAVQAKDRNGTIQLRQGIKDFRNSGGELYRPSWLARLAESFAEVGELEEALDTVAEAIEVMHATEEYVHHSE